ncbi:MAG: 1,4-alpha-glucan branching protein GlgB [Parasporobacterium sp.]|nr:1,4-alpha-glucan branching protein GlgB [Parasporobacterium sp.]
MIEFPGQEEVYLFKEGTWNQSYQKLGAHPFNDEDGVGYQFVLWAPNAKSVHLVGDFNEWDENANPMTHDESGEFWGIKMPGVKEGDIYKYLITDKKGKKVFKADPYAFYAEVAPNTASVLYDIEGYKWSDKRWMNARAKTNHMENPLNIYEVHLGSWSRNKEGEYQTYQEMADELVKYVVDMGYTHVEMLPVMEHPFEGSWGYQATGYFAPTARYGEPKDFMYLVDSFHKNKIGVILDWPAGHFCKDEHGLYRFDGSKLFEKGEHPQWGTCKFDFGKGQVCSFLLSNAHFWLEKYHADGIRVDGVTSMLYLNFGVENKKDKVFNKNGTEEDLDAIAFVQNLNKNIGISHPDIIMVAEESTAWPMVTYPPEDGGLGFHYKWDMGWMNDTLHYMQTDFPFRPGNHTLLTFSMMYTFNENFILALSHDEVVHGKCSLIRRMPGDYWRQFAGLRALSLYQMTHPGAKLNFMGNEIAEFIEWRYYESLEWFLPEKFEAHKKHQDFIKAINHFYKDEKALWQKSYTWEGFSWIDADNNEQSILSYIRKGKQAKDDLIVVINFTPTTYTGYYVGIPRSGVYEVIFNSDDELYGGSGQGDHGDIKSEKGNWHGQKNGLKLTIPPIGGIVLKRKAALPKKTDSVKQVGKKVTSKAKKS